MQDTATNGLIQQAQAVIDKGSKSFAAATRLFTPGVRGDVMLLYTWCRYCDDLTDGQQLGHGAIRTASSDSIRQLRADSLSALAGNPNDELPFQALAALSTRRSISPRLVEAHIHGFEMDVAGWQPKTLDDTLEYCYHTAGTVGVMMASLMGARESATLYRACDLGIAFQLTNIARDVVEDALAGRSYLPQDWRHDAGLEIADLSDPANRNSLFPLVERLVEEAEPYYRSAAIGIRALPRRAAWAVASARMVYRDIGREVIRRGPDGLGKRVFTSKARKGWRVVTAIPDALAQRRTHAADSRARLWTPAEIA